MVPRGFYELKARQQGIALVSILLVVAIATVMAVSMVKEQQASIQLTRGFLSRGQANQYALGGEELARQILFEDFSTGTGVDHMAETWADPELHFEFDDGEVHLTITDLQSLINLNGLADESPTQNQSRQRLVNLINALGADPGIADRVQDWIDGDTSVRGAGAEDFEYLLADPPYRAGNAPMTDVSEFWLLGYEVEVTSQLIAYLTALPDSSTSININTAGPAVLQSLASGLSFESADALVQRRDEQEGFESLEAFIQTPELAGLGVVSAGLGVQSAFFEVRIIARYQDRYSYLTSMVHRHPVNGSMRVISRDFSKSYRPALSDEEDDRG